MTTDWAYVLTWWVRWFESTRLYQFSTFQDIPTDELPDVQPPVVTIQTEYKGASAEIIDTQITQKIEDFVGGTQGLETIDSFSEDESSRITLTFAVMSRFCVLLSFLMFFP